MATDLLLCNPYFIRDDPVTRQAMDIYPLLGHGYLASYLEARGFGIEIFDGTFEKDLNGYLDALDTVRPRMAGVYGHVISRRNAFEFARAARERGLPVIAGGPDATGYYRDYLYAGFDVVVRSEGEETAHELLEWRRSGADRALLAKIPGIAYRTDGGEIATTNLRPFIADVDSLPFPRRDPHVYAPYVDAWRRRHGYVSMAIFGARGCPYDCTFCYRPVFGRNYRRRSPRRIVAEIEECAARFGATQFRFVDDTFVVSRPWVHELSDLIDERGLDVSFEVLARTHLMTDDVAMDLKRMGVRRIFYGMESGSDAVLTRMSKRLSVEDSVKAAEITHRHGMEFLSWIMLGYPGEEKEDIYRTRDLIVKARPDVLSISVAFPIRGTAFHDEVKDRISRKRPFWRRTGENRMVWQGRYPDLFYMFARRWLHKEAQLSRHAYRQWMLPLHLALRAAYRLGMEAISITRRHPASWATGGPLGVHEPGPAMRNARRPRARQVTGSSLDGAAPARTPDNLSNRTHGGSYV
ncbi:MAG: B12-binding domain-containing radical SAM protein [Chloroflexi bacterium]|nr:B12-binding domain-containing radical SAM protein [Chloroflexota bacterium]